MINLRDPNLDFDEDDESEMITTDEEIMKNG